MAWYLLGIFFLLFNYLWVEYNCLIKENTQMKNSNSFKSSLDVNIQVYTNKIIIVIVVLFLSA